MESKNTIQENWIDENIIILDLRKMESLEHVILFYDLIYLRILEVILPLRYEAFKLSILISFDKVMTLSLDYFIPIQCMKERRPWN